MSERLAWPPLKEDLVRLYVDEGLSAMKIARVYGLRYASPKTAESTVLYHLKRNGIARRDPAEHVLKVTGEMVDQWVTRYRAGESLKEIAGSGYSPVTVWNHLRRRGVKLRDKVEAQISAVTRHERKRFTGDESEKNYLLGFVLGDCSVARHGRGIRVRSGSTHPLFVKLFADLLGAYGHLRMYPKDSGLVKAELNLQIDLDGSFEFLLWKNIRPLSVVPSNTTAFLSFIAGFFDAEGSVYFHRKSYSPSFELSITNTNRALLKKIQLILMSMNHHPKMYHFTQHGTRFEGGKEGELWRLTIHRRDEVRRLLTVLPLRHEEKVTKAKLALSFLNSDTVLDSKGLPSGWHDYLEKVRQGRKDFVTELSATLQSKSSSRTNVQ